MLYFLEIIQLLVEETNKYYEQHLDTLHERWSPVPDVTIQEIYFILATIVQMEHGQENTLK
jgi:hypothetical protein